MKPTQRIRPRRVAYLFLTLLWLLGSRVAAEEPKERATLRGHKNSVWALAVSPDGKIAASGSHDKTVKLWDIATGKELITLDSQYSFDYPVAFSPDGKTLASGGESVRFWDVATGKLRFVLEVQSGQLYSLVFSPDGKMVALSGKGNVIQLWNLASRKKIAVLPGHTNLVVALAFHPDGRTLFSGSWDGTAKWWELASGKERATFAGQRKGVTCLALAPDGQSLAVGGHDETVRLWDLASGKERAALTHAATVYSLAFTPDGNVLASAGGDKTVKLWDPIDVQNLAALPGHDAEVFALGIGLEGKTLVSGGKDNTVRLWDMPMVRLAKVPHKPSRSVLVEIKDFGGLWTALAETDPVKGYRAMQTLQAGGDQTATLLSKRLRPVVGPRSEEIARWIADLDSRRFAVRQKATEALENLGEFTGPALRKRLAEKPSLEVTRRIERLLERNELTALPPGWLQYLRSMEVLEAIGTPEARRTVEAVASGAPGARMTTEAKNTLERMARRARRP